jgi:hypothetical protein
VTDQPQVDMKDAVSVLIRSELGAAMWRAATYEALTEQLLTRVGQLEGRRGDEKEGSQ